MNFNSPEAFGFGIEREWLHQRRLVIIKSSGVMGRESVDVWASVSVDTIRNWPDDRPLYILYDMTDHRVSFTPYSLQRTYELAALPLPSTGVYAGVVIQNRMARIQMQTVVRFVLCIQQGVTVRIFDTRENGLYWLQHTGQFLAAAD